MGGKAIVGANPCVLAACEFECSAKNGMVQKYIEFLSILIIKGGIRKSFLDWAF